MTLRSDVPAAAPETSNPVTRPADALADLLAGNRRFVGARPLHGHEVAAAAASSGGQQPHAVVLGCIDSRVPLEAIFDQTFGSICVVRSGGHVVDRAVLGSVAFAVKELKVSLIMVLGHERCGAVTSTVEVTQAGLQVPGDIAYLVDEISPAVRAARQQLSGPQDESPAVAELAAAAMRVHVGRTVRRLKSVTAVPEALAAGRVDVVGAVYDLDTGWVNLLP